MAYINAVLLRAMFGARAFAQRVRDEVGQDTIEWVMLSGLVALGIIGIGALLTGYLQDMVTGIGRCIDFDSTSVCTPGF